MAYRDPEKQREAMRAWRERNRARIAAYMREWRRLHRDTDRARARIRAARRWATDSNYREKHLILANRNQREARERLDDAYVIRLLVRRGSVSGSARALIPVKRAQVMVGRLIDSMEDTT